MKRQPTLPVNQVQKRRAVPKRGQPRTASWQARWDRPGIQQGAYDPVTGSAFFRFGPDRLYEYLNFSLLDFQLLMQSGSKGRLFMERFYRWDPDGITVIPAAAIPASPGLEFTL